MFPWHSATQINLTGEPSWHSSTGDDQEGLLPARQISDCSVSIRRENDDPSTCVRLVSSPLAFVIHMAVPPRGCAWMIERET